MSLTLARVLGEDGYERCEPLFEEYVGWVVDRLGYEYGIIGVDPRRHHEAFRAELPSLIGARGRLYVAELDGERSAPAPSSRSTTR